MSEEIASLDDIFAADDVLNHFSFVELPDGKLIKVRGLTRYELVLAAKGEPTNNDYEQRILSYCVVEPKMTVQQVEAWQKNSRVTGLIEKVILEVRKLSGLFTDDDNKSV